MPFLSWLFPAAKRARESRPPESSGLSRVEPTRPVSQRRAPPPLPDNGHAGNRKSERLARREQLYAVVREAMTRAGVLSASYKFKVLSLDARGTQFLIMMDVARGFADDTGRLAEIEALIAQSARARYAIVVTAVYWRMNEHVAVGMPQPRPAAQTNGTIAVAEVPTARPVTSAVIAIPVSPSTPGPARSRHEPLKEDEVAAFKRALALGTGMVATDAGLAKSAASNYTLLTGYEDTEMTKGSADGADLSGTQYGALN